MIKKRIFIMGNKFWALGLLQYLDYCQHTIVGLCTRYERPWLRPYRQFRYGMKPLYWAKNHDIPIIYGKDLNNIETTVEMQALKPDYIFVAGFHKKIPRDIFTICPTINFHPSLLPKYKGKHPIERALKDGADIGVTAHMVNEKWDSGPIIMQKKIKKETKPTITNYSNGIYNCDNIDSLITYVIIDMVLEILK